MDATAARVLSLRRRFAATSVSELLGRPGKADSVAEREEFGPWVSLGEVSGRRVRAKTIVPIAGDRGFESRFLQRRVSGELRSELWAFMALSSLWHDQGNGKAAQQQ
jgi:hypothetical protein